MSITPRHPADYERDLALFKQAKAAVDRLDGELRLANETERLHSLQLIFTVHGVKIGSIVKAGDRLYLVQSISYSYFNPEKGVMPSLRGFVQRKDKTWGTRLLDIGGWSRRIEVVTE